MRAFWDLNTCRQVGMGLGLIPWDKVVEYGHHAGLDSDMIDPFVKIIRAMDGEYIKWQDAEAEKRRNRDRSGNKQKE